MMDFRILVERFSTYSSREGMEERLRVENLALFVNGYSVVKCSLFAADRLVSYLKNWRANYESSDVLIAGAAPPPAPSASVQSFPRGSGARFATG